MCYLLYQDMAPTSHCGYARRMCVFHYVHHTCVRSLPHAQITCNNTNRLFVSTSCCLHTLNPVCTRSSFTHDCFVLLCMCDTLNPWRETLLNTAVLFFDLSAVHYMSCTAARAARLYRSTLSCIFPSQHRSLLICITHRLTTLYPALLACYTSR